MGGGDKPKTARAKPGKCAFTGKEPSPKGLGRCARNERVGTYAVGRDKTWWIVTPVGKTGQRWARLAPAGAKPSGKAVVVERGGRRYLMGPAISF
eukprot:jgi/Tetstr1/464143/TSEL_008948.t1